jgi:hypothetical protein
VGGAEASARRETNFGTNPTFAWPNNCVDLFRAGVDHALVMTAVYTAGFVMASLLLNFGIVLPLDANLP